MKKISKTGVAGALAGVGLLAYGVFKLVTNKTSDEDTYVEAIEGDDYEYENADSEDEANEE